MDRIAAARQALFEHELLEHLKKALRRAIEWPIDQVGLARKRSTVCFTADSLGRHLERLMEIEEEGGYMRDVIERKPHFAEKAKKLLADHTRFREELRHLLPTLARRDSLDEQALAELCASCLLLLAQVDEHDRHEIDMYQEGMLSEEGSGD
jgi:hypothetical protein